MILFYLILPFMIAPTYENYFIGFGIGLLFSVGSICLALLINKIFEI